MADEQKIYLACPECHQRYRWKAHYAGQRVRCANCRAKLRYPQQPSDPMTVLKPSPEADASDAASSNPPSDAGSRSDAPAEPSQGETAETSDTYALAEDPDARDSEPGNQAAKPPTSATSTQQSAGSTPGRCPQCNSRLKDGAVVCINCGFNLKDGKALETEVHTEPAQAKPSDRGSDAGKRRTPTSSSGQSLIDQQKNAEQPAEVTTYKATQKREAARKARAEAEHEEEARKRGFLYPVSVLSVAGGLQLIANFVQPGVEAGGLALAVGSVLALIAQGVVMVPLIGVVFGVAGLFGMLSGSAWSGLLRAGAVTLAPFAVANLLTNPLPMPGELAAFGMILWGVIALVMALSVIVPLFKLEYLEAMFLAVAVLLVELAGWAFNHYAAGAIINVLA